MKKLFISAFIIIGCCSFSLTNKDSISNKLKEVIQLTGIKKAERLNELAEKSIKDSAELSIILANKALDIALKNNLLLEEAKAYSILAKAYKVKNSSVNVLKYDSLNLNIRKQIGDKKYIAQAYNNIAMAYASEGLFEKSIENYRIALQYKSLLNDSTGKGIVYNNIANVYFKIGNYHQALEYYQKALTIFEKIRYNQGLASSLNGCGLVFENLSNFNKALEFYNKALLLSEKMNNASQQADLQINMGNVCSKQKHYDDAITNYNKALHIGKELNDKEEIATSLNNIGLIYKIKHEYIKAVSYFKEALQLFEETKNVYEISHCLNAIGKSYLELSDYTNATSYIEKSLQIAKNNGDKEMIQQNYVVLSDIYSNRKQFEKALYFHKQSDLMEDTIQNIQIKKQVYELETKYETEKKERELQILSKQSEIQKLQINKSRFFVIGLASLAIILMLFGFLIIRNYKINLQRKSLILEQKLLRIQMNPHFIFNALSSIQSFIFEKDQLLAGKYISDFAKLMRLILENSREEFVVLEKEIDTLKYYLELQKLRYEDKFEYSIAIDQAINPELIIIPPMLGQPFVENSIKHGIEKKETKGLIQVRFIKHQEVMLLEIEDNGIGRKEALQMQQSENNKHLSLAMSITHDRLENFNARNRKKINFTIIDLEHNGEAKGTIVRFEIPLSYPSTNQKT